jgi:hypothetical protein
MFGPFKCVIIEPIPSVGETALHGVEIQNDPVIQGLGRLSKDGNAKYTICGLGMKKRNILENARRSGFAVTFS